LEEGRHTPWLIAYDSWLEKADGLLTALALAGCVWAG
jgi:hypothetical protein